MSSVPLFPILSYFVTPHRVVSHFTLSLPILIHLLYQTIPCLAMSYSELSFTSLPCLALPCPALSCPARFYYVLYYPTLLSSILPCPVLPYHTLPDPTLPCPVLPCPVRSCLTLPCHILSFPLAPSLPTLRRPAPLQRLTPPHPLPAVPAGGGEAVRAR